MSQTKQDIGSVRRKVDEMHKAAERWAAKKESGTA